MNKNDLPEFAEPGRVKDRKKIRNK